jgi:hypothetical protein
MLKTKQLGNAILAAGMLFSPLFSMAAELNVDQLLGELESQMKIGKDRLEKLKPELKSTLEAKSQELSSSLDSVLDQGLTELEKMGAKYEAASEEYSEELRQLLNSDEVDELKTFLSGLDKQAIGEARDQLVAEFIEVLNLTAAQIEKIKPLLKEKLEELGTVLRAYLGESKAEFEQFRVEFEAKSKKNSEQFKAILDAEQFKKFEGQLKSIEESIRSNVFEA